MEIPEKLLKFRFHILSASALGLLILLLCYLAPRFVDILKYFWPLLLSTVLFLATIVVFGRISPPAAESLGEKAGEGLLSYVASEPEPIHSLLEEVEAEGSGKALKRAM